MEQNREPRIKPRPLVNYYLTKEAIACNGIKTVSSINGFWRTGLVLAQNKIIVHLDFVFAKDVFRAVVWKGTYIHKITE